MIKFKLLKEKIFLSKKLTKEQQIKRSFMKGMLIGSVLMVGTITIYQSLVLPRVRQKAINDMIEKEKKSKVMVYKLKKDLKQGDLVTSNDFYSTYDINVPKDSVYDEKYIKSLDKKGTGKRTRMKLLANTTLTESMLTKDEEFITDDTKEQDFYHITLNKNLKSGDYVDVVLKRKDGSTEVVVSKKKTSTVNGNMIDANWYSKERDYIYYATVDAAITGGTLFTVIYPDPLNQIAADVTYVPNENIKQMVNKNPNIVKDSEVELRNRNNSGGSSTDNTQNNNSNNNQSQSNNDGKPQFIDGGKK